MSVTSTDLIAAAHKSQAAANCEGDWRGVCARAYYAIYEDGKAFHDSLPSVGALKNGSVGGKHQNLIEQLQNPTIPRSDSRHSKSRSIGYIMATLHGNRIKSDYKRHESVDEPTAKNSIALMNNLAATLASLASSTTASTSVANQPASPAAPSTPSAGGPSGQPANAPTPAGTCRPTLQRIK